MARRGENIRKRKDGRWEGRYTKPSPSGKGKVCSVYAASYAEVKKKLALLKKESTEEAKNAAEPETGTDVSFQKAAEGWLAQCAGCRKHSTYVKYRTIYETYLKPHFAGWDIRGMDSMALEETIAQDGRIRSDSTKRSIYCVLGQILEYSARAYSTPLLHYEKEFSGKKQNHTEVLNSSEQAALLSYLYQDMDAHKMGVVLCLSTGLRLGEICSLKWGDIDFDRKTLRVNSTVQRIAAQNQRTKTILWEGEPKSICSRREIPISDEILLLLTKYKTAEKYVLNADKPMEPRTYQNKYKSFLQACGVKGRNFHALRHTFATNCIENGADVKSLSEMLGHSNVQITLNRYVHPSLHTKRQHMNRLSSIYGQLMGQTV